MVTTVTKDSITSMAIKYHEVKLTDMHIWGMYANIYATYELVTINAVATNAVYKRQGQPIGYIWPNQPKPSPHKEK